METKKRIRLISAVLFVAVFALWALFYFIISGYIAESTQNQITMAANQIIERLGGEFAEMESLSYMLKHDDGVATLLSEQDRRRYFVQAGDMDVLAEAADYNADFVHSIVLYGPDNHFYRLAGTLGNKACSYLAGAVSSAELPSHLSIELDGQQYIAYADSVEQGGAVAILIEEEKVLEVLRAYDQSGALLVVVSAGGETVTANTDRAEAIEASGMRVIRSGLGITPYEITVAADRGYMNASVVFFSIVAIITAALFAAVLLMYTRLLNRRFFRPMMGVIESIRHIRTAVSAERLPYVNSEEFDYLIDRINAMLVHIEAQNADVRTAELRAKNAEIEKQKALVFSLKKQINAHFTVNTLEAIRNAVEQGELNKAGTMMSGLMRLVHYAHSKEETINIWDEIELLKYFAAIMNSRYGGKLTAEFELDESLIDADMPRMLLQPLMENAIVHGFKDMEGGCVISVKAELRSGFVYFSVGDNGCGMAADELCALRAQLRSTDTFDGLTNIALLNIRNRLHYYYGDAAKMDIKPGEKVGIEVSFVIPFTAGQCPEPIRQECCC